jgi:hypothetical protein
MKKTAQNNAHVADFYLFMSGWFIKNLRSYQALHGKLEVKDFRHAFKYYENKAIKELKDCKSFEK